MAYEETRIGKLVDSDPDKAVEALLGLFQRTAGNAVHAALLAGVHHATLKRWVAKLDETHGIRAKIERIRAKAAEPHTLTDAARERLTERADERRWLDGLRRTFDRLGEAQVEAMAAKLGLKPATLATWRRTVDAVAPRTARAIEERLERLQAKQRAAMREANRERFAR